jgi:hypothetical protein
MNLGCAISTINTFPIIAFKHYITLSFPVIRLEVNIPVVVSARFSLPFKPPMFIKLPENENRNKENNKFHILCLEQGLLDEPITSLIHPTFHINLKNSNKTYHPRS